MLSAIFPKPYKASEKVREEFDKFKKALEEGDKPGIVIEHTNKLLELDRSFYIINERGLRENVFTVLRDQYIKSKGTVDRARLFYAILEQWGAAASVEPEWEARVAKTQQAETEEQKASKALEEVDTQNLGEDALEAAQQKSEETKEAVANAKAEEIKSIYTLKLLRDYVQYDELKTPVSLVYLGLLMSRMSERLRNAVIESQEWEDVQNSDPQNAEVLEYLRLLRSAGTGNELRNLAGDIYRKYRKKLLYGNQDDWMFTETATLMADVRPTLRRKLEFLQHSGGESANLLSGTDQPVVDKEKFGAEGMLSWSVEFSKRSVRATVRAKAFDNAEKNPTDEKVEEASVVVERTDNKTEYVATSTSPLLRTDADAALLNTAVLQVNDALVTLTTLFVKSDYYFSIERLVYDTKAEKAKVEAQAKAVEAQAKAVEARSEYDAAVAELLELFGAQDPQEVRFLGKAARDRRVENEFDKLFELAKTLKQRALQVSGIDLEAEEAEFKKVYDGLEALKAVIIEKYDKLEMQMKREEDFKTLLKPNKSVDPAEIANRRRQLEDVYRALVVQHTEFRDKVDAAEQQKADKIEERWAKDYYRAIVKYTKLEEKAKAAAAAAEAAATPEAIAAAEAKNAEAQEDYELSQLILAAAAPGPDLDALLADHATSMRRVRDLLETD